jgi:hypothetical protein
MLRCGYKKVLLTMNVFALAVCWIVFLQPAQAANLRILMVDGTSLEVPFCWEEEGMIKFEMPGGNAGIPKSSVASIQEIITTGEFNPQVMVKSSTASRGADKNKALNEISQAQSGPKPAYETLTPDEAARLLDLRTKEDVAKEVGNIRIFSTTFRQQADFSDFARVEGTGMLLVMKQILSTHQDLRNKRFTLSLYDAQGNVLQRKPCEISELKVDKKTLRQMGISGTLFTLVATVRPDAKIKRFEITSVQD